MTQYDIFALNAKPDKNFVQCSPFGVLLSAGKEANFLQRLDGLVRREKLVPWCRYTRDYRESAPVVRRCTRHVALTTRPAADIGVLLNLIAIYWFVLVNADGGVFFDLPTMTEIRRTFMMFSPVLVAVNSSQRQLARV